MMVENSSSDSLRIYNSLYIKLYPITFDQHSVSVSYKKNNRDQCSFSAIQEKQELPAQCGDNKHRYSKQFQW